MREQDFPELDQVYLDSACMSLRPEQVIEAVREYYTEYPACPGRGNHKLSETATGKMEEARERVADFIDADRGDIIFTSGTTEGINTVSRGFPTERVILSDREHNSNLVPWQRSPAEVEVVETGAGFVSRLEQEVKEGDLVSLVHVSNLDGYEISVREVSEIVRDKGAHLLVDAAQSIPHRSFSVRDIDPDFVAFSGHKMLGPSGTGALYVADRVKSDLEPLKLGGGGVRSSTFETHDRKEFPHGFESGLPNVAGNIGFGEAANYLQEVGMENVHGYEKELTEKLYEGIESIEGIENVGSRAPGVISLRVGELEANQAALMLDQRGIAVRSGMHCVHSWFEAHGERPTLRASLHLYNSEEDIEEFLSALREIAVLG